METVGFIGIGKIGLPICKHLLNDGYRVVGYRRSSLSDFEELGGIAARSPAEVAAATDIVFMCLPDDEALDSVINGPAGLINSVREGQIVVEFGSHPVSVKKSYIGPLADKGAVFLDGEVGGTPGMVAARKGVIYLSGDTASCEKLKPMVKSFAETSFYLGPFGSSTIVKLINNILVGLHIAGAAEVMAIGLRTGIDIDLMIQAVAQGSGGSTEFAIRAPWMAQRKFTPQKGSASVLLHYLERGKELADQVGVDTPLLAGLLELFRQAVPLVGERDVAAVIELFERRTAPERVTDQG